MRGALLCVCRCDLFVGKFTSNFFRTAYELHAARCDCAAPFVSLDAPWCFDHGVSAGENWDFPLTYRGVVQPNRFGC